VARVASSYTRAMPTSRHLRPLSAVALLFGLGCSLELDVPANAQVMCTSDAACPVGMRCEPRLGRCYTPGENQPPAVTIGLVPRSLSPVQIPLTVFDTEGDPVSLRVEVDAGSGFVPASISTTTLASSAEGTAGTLAWNAAADLGTTGYRPALRVRVTPADATGVGTPTVSDAFDVGNDVPAVNAVSVDDAVVAGVTVVRFHVTDTARDPVTVTAVRLSLAGDFSDTIEVPLDAGPSEDFPAGGLDGLPSDDPAALPSPIVPHALVWNSALAAPVSVPGARLAIVVTDGLGASSAATPSPAFGLHNATSAPVLTITSQPASSAPGVVQVGFHLADADGDAARVVVEFSIDGGTVWAAASSSSVTVNLPPGEHLFLWQATQLGYGAYTGVKLRLSASDARDEAAPVVSNPFDVDNSAVGANARPSVTVHTVVPPGGGRYLTVVGVPFSLVDQNNGDLEQVAVAYSLDYNATSGVGTWTNATGSCDGGSECTCDDDGCTGLLAAGASGTEHVFYWDGLADLPTTTVAPAPDGVASATVVAPIAQVFVRIIATDTGTPTATSVPATSPAFAVGNAAPMATLTEVAASQRGTIPIEVTLADGLADLADLEVEFRENPSGSPSSGVPWRTAYLSLGTTSRLATTPGGSTYVVVWNSAWAANDDDLTAAQGLGGRLCEHVEVRVRGLDHPRLGTSHYGAWATSAASFVVVNQTPPRIEGLAARRAELAAGVSPIAIGFRLIDEELDPTDIKVEYTQDFGKTWVPCREYPQPESEGRYQLATSPSVPDGDSGMRHTFVWDPTGTGWDLPASTVLRVTATDGNNTLRNSASIQLVHPATPSASAPQASPYLPAVAYGDIHAWRVVAADFNGDGWLDLVTSEFNDRACIVLASAAHDGTFESTCSRLPGSDTTGAAATFAAGDFDANGRMDLVGFGYNDGKLSVFTGDGAGGFSRTLGPMALGDYYLGGSTQPVAVDLDGNGALDIVVACVNTTTSVHGVCVLRGNATAGHGDGTFDTGAILLTSLPSWSDDLIVTDFDKDGKLDLVVWSYVLLGHGDGTFGAPIDFSEGDENPSSHGLAVADANGDGIADIIYASRFSPALVYPGGGSNGVWDGTFGARILSASSFAGGALALDVNGDGVTDLVGYGDYAMNVAAAEVMLGHGDGTFAPAAYYLTGNVNSDSTLAADLNRDGLPDLVVGGDRVAVLLARPDGGIGASNFALPTTLGSTLGAGGFVIADFNGDGRLDLAMAVPGKVVGEGPPTPGSLEVWLQNGDGGVGDGSFAAPTTYAIGKVPRDLVASDFNGDGITDLALALVRSGYVGLLLGNGHDHVGDGTFAAEQQVAVASGVGGLQVADFDGDGALDLAVSTADATSGSDVVVLRGHETGGIPDGTFAAGPSSLIDATFSASALRAADVNGDGKPDVIATIYTSSDPDLAVGINQGDGSFVFATSEPGAGDGMVIADFDGDGIRDIAGTENAIWPTFKKGEGALGVGDGTFASRVTTMSIGFTGDAEVGDFDGDGALDLAARTVLAGERGGGLGDGTFTLAIPADTEASLVTAVGDLNGDGVLDLVRTGNSDASVVLGQAQGFLSWSRPLSEPGARIGTAVLPTCTDRFGAACAAAVIGQHRANAREGATARPFIDELRTSGLAVPRGLVPLTEVWQTTGTVRFSRVAGPVVAGVADAGPRLRLENRLGPRASPGSPTDFSRLGLDLGGASPRGVVVELPIVAGRSDVEIAAALAAGGIRVYRRDVDYLRADETADDPMHADASAHAFLPRVPAGGGTFRDVIVARPVWRRLDYVPSLGSGSGPRFTIDTSDPLRRRLRVATDRLGTFQAFLVAAP
jgi:hypothetical protein